MRWLTQWFMPRKKKRTNVSVPVPEPISKGSGTPQISNKAWKNKEELHSIFGGSEDFHISDIIIGGSRGFICYLNSMTEQKLIAEQIMKPLAAAVEYKLPTIRSARDLEKFRQIYFAGPIHAYYTQYHDAVSAILSGSAVIIADGVRCALAIHIEGIPNRSIQEPTTQTSVRGPKEGFIESIQTNISLIRRRIQNPRLRFESYVLGTDTRTDVVLAFLDQVVDSGILDEVRKRISDIKVSAILDSGNVKEMIEDRTFTPFPTILSTERPDQAAGSILEGKIAILVNGSPFALVVPSVFSDFFSTPEDYFERFSIASLIRLVRYIAFMLTLILPSGYVAITTFHQELIPTPLLISIASQREGVPFPSVVEILMMETTFEILREAGIRMPRAVGQTVSIVGALVIGQAAVEAGIVSNILIIVIALTAISNFVSPVYSFAQAARIVKFVLILMASIFGLYGLILGLVFMVAHLACLRSFGVPFMSPIAPFKLRDMDDVFIRFPYWSLKKRPSYLHSKVPDKSPLAESPSPPEQGGNPS